MIMEARLWFCLKGYDFVVFWMLEIDEDASVLEVYSVENVDESGLFDEFPQILRRNFFRILVASMRQYLVFG